MDIIVQKVDWRKGQKLMFSVTKIGFALGSRLICFLKKEIMWHIYANIDWFSDIAIKSAVWTNTEYCKSVKNFVLSV